MGRQAGTPNPIFAETGLERLLCSPSALQRSDTSVLFEALINSGQSESKTHDEQSTFETQIHDFLLVGSRTASELDEHRSSRKQLFTGSAELEAVTNEQSEQADEDARFDLYDLADVAQRPGALMQPGDAMAMASSFTAEPIKDSRALQLEAVQIRLCQERCHYLFNDALIRVDIRFNRIAPWRPPSAS
jgi:hypothetical protein